jgi:hypothetical protein
MKFAAIHAGLPRGAVARRRVPLAFTLVEVMIAMFVFFVVAFSIMGVVIQSLGAARSLQVRHPDAGMLAAELSLTNMLEEGFESGDFGDIYPRARWQREITEAGSNGFFRVDFAVYEKTPQGKENVETMSIFMHRPASPKRGMR